MRRRHDYARLRAHLDAGVRAGKDPQEILKEHGLNVYQFSQESGKWVQAMGRAAGTDELVRMQAIREKYEAEYRARYGLPARDPS